MRTSVQRASTSYYAPYSPWYGGAYFGGGWAYYGGWHDHWHDGGHGYAPPPVQALPPRTTSLPPQP